MISVSSIYCFIINSYTCWTFTHVKRKAITFGLVIFIIEKTKVNIILYYRRTFEFIRFSAYRNILYPIERNRLSFWYVTFRAIRQKGKSERFCAVTFAAVLSTPDSFEYCRPCDFLASLSVSKRSLTILNRSVASWQKRTVMKRSKSLLLIIFRNAIECSGAKKNRQKIKRTVMERLRTLGA